MLFLAIRTTGACLFIALALCTALAGCGGGGARSSVPSAGSAVPLQAGKASATFRIDIPTQATTAKRRAPRYVSPATTQLAIDIEQAGVPIAGYPVTVGLTPTSSGCSSTLASTNCQLTIALAPGDYTATLTTEDASSTPLSSAQSIAFTITAGTNNVISIVLSGIPHTLQIAAGARAMHGNGLSGLTLYGSAAQPVLVVALDADGNTIVGSGSPTFSASLVSGSGWSAAAPSTTSPNMIAITPPGTNGSGATFSVTASYSDATCSQSGAVCSASFTVKNDIQTLFVGNLLGGTVGTLTVYAPPYTGTPTTNSSGINSPFSLILNGAGDLFVANEGGDTVTEYAPPYTGTPGTTIDTGGDEPNALVLDGAGNLFVANNNDDTVKEYVPPYTGAAAATISTGVNSPFALLLDGAGDLFVANVEASTVTEYAPPYTGTPTTISSGVGAPTGVAFDGAGDLFVTNILSNTVTEYAAPYTGTPTTTISRGVDFPLALVLDGAGDLFVANNHGATVTEYVPPYTGTPTTISTGVSQPIALALDGAGNLFVANASTVTEYAPPYTGTPTTISTGVSGPRALLLTP